MMARHDANAKKPLSVETDVIAKETSREAELSPSSPFSPHSHSSDASLHSEDHDGSELGLTPHASRVDGNPLSRHVTGISVATNATGDPAFEVDFEENDPDNPKNWPMWYKVVIIFFLSYSTMTVVLYSTSYTSGMPGIMQEFHIFNDTIPVLGVTTYLLGLAVGSVILAPLSEMYGRRPIYLVAQTLFAILILPCALATNLEAILIGRFFGAVAGSAMIGNAPGTVNDIVSEKYRALAFSIWSIGPMNGPVIGPLVGGFVFQYLGWRWTNWVVMISSGLTLVMLFLVKETYAPTILRKKAAKLRKETDDRRWHCRYDEKKPFWGSLAFNLKRPFTLTFTEPICIFWDLYIALVYGVLYLCFVAYPIVFQGSRHWGPGLVGLAYMGIGVGGLITIGLEPVYRRLINSHKVDPATGRPPPESMVSIVCIASILIPVGELIFAWTCTPDVHWIVPILAGIPFGAGNCAVFIYATNYLVHSYGIYAASALAGNAVFRSLMGATLPLAGPTMYATLGPHWAGTLLALLEFALVPIPFVFYRYGHKIRGKSRLIREMREDAERAERKRGKMQGKSGGGSVAAKVEEKLGVHEAEELAVGQVAALAVPVAGAEGMEREMEMERKGGFSEKDV